MNPRLVWDVWRRTLADDRWKAAVERGDVGELAGTISAEELAILEDYASTTKATQITISMYRNRLPTVARGALAMLAPYTKRLFDQLEDAQRADLTRRYVIASGNRDDGPQFCRTAADFLTFLAGDPLFTEAPGWVDIATLELASVRLQRRLGRDAWQAPAPSDPGLDDHDGETYADFDAWTLVWCGNAETAQLEYNVTPWLEQPETTGEGLLFPGPTWWIASLADNESEVTYSQISEREFAVYALLDQPLQPAAVGARTPQLAEPDVLSILGELLDLGVIRAIRA